MSIESVMPSNHLISCHPLLLPSVFPSIRVFSNELALPSGGQTTGASALASVFPVNIQGWFPLRLTGLIPLKSKRLSSVFSNMPQFKSINSFALGFLYGPTLTSIHDYWKNHNFDYIDLCWQSDVSGFNMLSRFLIAFLPKSECLLILWLQSLSAVILETNKMKYVTVSTFSPSICHEVVESDAMILVF